MELALTAHTTQLALLSTTPRGQLVPYTSSVYLVHGGAHVEPPCLVAVDGIEFTLALSVDDACEPYALLEALHRAYWHRHYDAEALAQLLEALRGDEQHPRYQMALLYADGLQEVRAALKRADRYGDRLQQVRDELPGYDGLFIVKRAHLLAVSSQCRHAARLRKHKQTVWRLVLDNHAVVQWLVDRLRHPLYVANEKTAVRVWRALPQECLEALDEKRPDAQLYVTQQTLPLAPHDTLHWRFGDAQRMQQCYVHSACTEHAAGELSPAALLSEAIKVAQHPSLNVFDFWSTALPIPLLRVDYDKRVARLAQDARPEKHTGARKTKEKEIKVRGDSAFVPIAAPGQRRLQQPSLVAAPLAPFSAKFDAAPPVKEKQQVVTAKSAKAKKTKAVVKEADRSAGKRLAQTTLSFGATKKCKTM